MLLSVVVRDVVAFAGIVDDEGDDEAEVESVVVVGDDEDDDDACVDVVVDYDDDDDDNDVVPVVPDCLGHALEMKDLDCLWIFHRRRCYCSCYHCCCCCC